MYGKNQVSVGGVAPSNASHASAKGSPYLPCDVVNHIVRLTVRFRDLSASSVLSKSWRDGCESFMQEVRSLALDGFSSGTEPALTGRCISFAQDFAIRRLSRKAGEAETVSNAQIKLIRNLPLLWIATDTTPTFSQYSQLFFNFRELDRDACNFLVKAAAKTRAMQVLMLDPDAKAVICPDSWDDVTVAARKSLEEYLESENIGGGALRDYPRAIGKFGKGMTPKYGSPFHRILFASLLYRPKAFFELIQLASKCNAQDFFAFSERVRSHFHGDGNILVTLELTTARWLTDAEEDDLSSVPYTVLLKAVNRVYDQYLRVNSFTREQKSIVEDSRRHSMLGIAIKAGAIIKVIPKEQVNSRRMVLEPLMRYLRKLPDSDAPMTLVKDHIKTAASMERWLPGDPDLKFTKSSS